MLFHIFIMMFKYVIGLIFCIGVMGDSLVPDTVLQYDILMRNKLIGSLEVSRKTVGTVTTYQSFTRIKTKLLTPIAVDYKYVVSFDNELLQRANVNIWVNDRPHAETSTSWKNNQYRIVKNKKESNLEDSIDYTTILLYFKEPKHIDYCYSEQDGTMNTIVALGNHSYKKINANGKENLYFYKKGVLHHATIDGGVVSFEMRISE
ncbi:hypothetical protein SAMN05421766_102572 [Zobellia uliginosa]|uniref:Alginate lyase n=2 Tax=Zobellia uliginosa TaxID=143224 RepID=A0ABY1KNA5_9FLAO|nr:hypothetical protein SAMN05421766_102572 [Zobellia uliginosa]